MVQEAHLRGKVSTFTFIATRRVADNNPRSSRRIAFTMGDFVRFQECRIGRIEGIFVYTSSKSRVFLKLIIAHTMAERDAILNVDRLQLSEERIIVGLSEVGSSTLYVVVDTQRKCFLLIPWVVRYL